MNQLAERAYRFLSGNRRVTALVIYGAVVAVAYAAAFLLRFELTPPEAYLSAFWLTLPVLVAIRLATLVVFGLNAGRWRFVGTVEVLRLALATGAGSVVFYAVTRVLTSPAVPLSVVVMELLLTGCGVASLWIGYRLGFEFMYGRRLNGNGPAKRVLMVGAGAAANMLALEMRRMSTGHRIVGFLDDDPFKWDTTLQGIPVWGPTAELVELAEKLRAEELLVAVPSASPKALRRLVERCEETNLPFRLLPGIREVLEGHVSIEHVREVRIEDLLGRDPIKLDLPELAEDLAGQTVLITGAAGSIGSELARQVARHGPALLVALDQAETELFYLRNELLEKYPRVPLVAVVGDVVDRPTLGGVFTRYRPTRVYHAAAYKHVPMMEDNPCEAVRNNVIGTWRVAEAAGEHGSQKFVLVSTDKAVRPSSVMGATKRLAEISVLELQRLWPETAFSAVRFGNVLGSNGSVVPIFKRQLQEGKPLTVTHPEATRFFMTIPEAVQLILQASLLDDLRGRVAMLDMGEPVRIMDLARNLIRLTANGQPNSAGIVITGLRPGEKLHEELVDDGEETVATRIPRVRLIKLRRVDRVEIGDHVAAWQHELDAGEDQLALARLSYFFPELGGELAEQIPLPAPPAPARRKLTAI